MTEFFQFFSQNSTGILVFLVFLFAMIAAVRWLASIFAIGRYSVYASRNKPTSIAYIFADLAVKIINDFRHLLALIIMLIFGLTLAYVLYMSTHANPAYSITDGLQAVIAAFGGIIGAVIGYYFGESAGRNQSGREASELIEQNIQQEPIDSSSGITPASVPKVTDASGRDSGDGEDQHD